MYGSSKFHDSLVTFYDELGADSKRYLSTLLAGLSYSSSKKRIQSNYIIHKDHE
jgi:hypothetical protein